MNNQTFEEFYLKYRKISRGYAYGVLHDWSIADDVSQDVLYKMYTIKDGLNIDNEKMMFSLIKRASMNKALDYIKKSSSKHEFVCQEEVAAFLEEQNSVDAEEAFLRKEKKEFMYMVLRRFRKKQPMVSITGYIKRSAGCRKNFAKYTNKRKPCQPGREWQSFHMAVVEI